MKTINQKKTVWLVTSCALFCSLAVKLSARDTNVDWGTASDDQVILQAVELTTPTPSNEVPAFATFYSAQHSPISSSPWPPLPGNMNDFNAWNLGSNIWVLDDLGFDYDASSASSSYSMMAMDADGLIPGGDSNGGTNIYSPAGSFISFDPGTNLWIAQEAVSGGNFTGILSNTIPGVEYQLLSMNSLNAGQWAYQGEPLLATTNSVPWSLPFSPTNNFFLNALSLQNDSGSGIPSWWLLKYYGQDTNVNIEALAPANDGWTIYQQYAQGDSPYAWITPPAPQGLAIDNFSATSDTANLSWMPSPGPVTGYILQTPNGNVSLSNNVTVYADSSSFPFASYAIRAEYAGGSSAWSPSISVDYSFGEQDSGSLQNVTSAEFVPGQLGVTYLALSGIPSGTATVRLEFFNFYGGGASSNYDISITSITNGLYPFPLSWFPPSDGDYVVSVQTIGTNGNASAGMYFSSYSSDWLEPWNWSVPYFDGRAQLLQNLNFLLREPVGDTPFSCGFTEPFGYAYAGFYETLTPEDGTNALDEYMPFKENYFYRNFVFSSDDIDANGALTTGIDMNEADNSTLAFSSSATYQFQEPSGPTNIPPLLTTNVAQWLISYPFEALYPGTNNVFYDLTNIGITYTLDLNTYGTTFTMSSGTENYFGLPIQSVNIAYNDGNFETNLLTPNSSTPEIYAFNEYTYVRAAQPQFQTVEYDFWNVSRDMYFQSGQQYIGSALPGNPGFALTNASDLLIASVGDTRFQVAGYAKLAVTNSAYPGVYAYLDQYFTNAYEIDDDGKVTTNSSGVVSPYGQFFATEPGPAALITMPDPYTGQQGTGVVYCISLNVDKNHDGVMDTSWNGPDETSPGSPCVFWCNNNFDRWATAADSRATIPLGIYYSEYEQDDQKSGGCPYTPNKPTPDCNYLNVYGNRQIPCARDLEDFARLWLSGFTSNLLASLPAGWTVSLNWGDVGSPNTNNPTIDLFAAADPDGGIGYQTNDLIASNQIDLTQSPYIGRLGPGDSIQLNSLYEGVLPLTHFIWCGVSNGTGGLNLTIADSNGKVIAQTTTYIQIVDIKQMYERWTVGDDPNAAPTNVPSLATEGLPPGVSAFQYTPPQEITPYIVFVHGFNMADWDKDFFAQTAYKRLYWQGYQGRFGAFQWPTTIQGANPQDFDISESQAWQSGAGLLNLLATLNNEYSGQVYLMAHSHGNVVAGEALRQATRQGLGQVVNTYIAMQAAVDSHTYDPTTPERSYSFGTPDCYGQYYTYGATNYFNGVTGAGNYVNFFNTNDWALSANVWQRDQNQKPDTGYGYDVYSDGEFSESEGGISVDIYFPTNTYTIFSFCDQAHAYALGAQPNVGGPFLNETNYNQINLPSIWPSDPSGHSYADHLWHSAEFRSDYPQRWLFWDEVLFQMGLKTQL